MLHNPTQPVLQKSVLSHQNSKRVIIIVGLPAAGPLAAVAPKLRLEPVLKHITIRQQQLTTRTAQVRYRRKAAPHHVIRKQFLGPVAADLFRREAMALPILLAIALHHTWAVQALDVTMGIGNTSQGHVIGIAPPLFQNPGEAAQEAAAMMRELAGISTYPTLEVDIRDQLVFIANRMGLGVIQHLQAALPLRRPSQHFAHHILTWQCVNSVRTMIFCLGAGRIKSVQSTGLMTLPTKVSRLLHASVN
jgi:hypothetical protein